VRSATWFSYASAQDSARAARRGGRDIYRVIYNGNWQEQVRTYDLGPSATGAGGVIDEARVRRRPGLTFSIPTTLALNDPLEPARAVRCADAADRSEYRALIAAPRGGRARPAGPADARLESYQFWWAAAACVNGSFVYNAWIYPTPRFAALRFPAVLLRHDQTGCRSMRRAAPSRSPSIVRTPVASRSIPTLPSSSMAAAGPSGCSVFDLDQFHSARVPIAFFWRQRFFLLRRTKIILTRL
jgi:hypothetical protein